MSRGSQEWEAGDELQLGWFTDHSSHLAAQIPSHVVILPVCPSSTAVLILPPSTVLCQAENLGREF